MKRRLYPFFAAALICGLMFAACGGSGDDKAVCGDGIIDEGEECDGDNLGGMTCGDLGYGGGTLACTDDCTFDTTGCYAAAECGNGIIEVGEECDSGYLGGATCESEGYDGGDLACNDDTCRFDVSGCCNHECSVEGETRCNGNVIQSCEMGQEGCRVWADVEDCEDNNQFCVHEDGDTYCADTCVDECSEAGIYQCDVNVVQVCEEGTNGCLVWADVEDCELNGQECVEDGDDAYCVFTCVSECTDSGDLRCNGMILEVCEEAADGCFYWETSVDCTDTDQVCDDYNVTPACVDQSSGEACDDAAIVAMGVNAFTGTFDDDPIDAFSCKDDMYNAIWVRFTAPQDDDYTILAQNNTTTWAYSRMVILDGTDCSPYGSELLCDDQDARTMEREITLTEGQTVLIVFSADGQNFTMVNPVITISRECDPDTEFTCNDGTCIPAAGRCDGTEHCPDGSDEWACIGDECTNAAEVFMGENAFTGIFHDDPIDVFSCADDMYNAIWLEFTAPEDGVYEIHAQNNTTTWPNSRMVILDGTDCSPYGSELLCSDSNARSMTEEVALTAGQTVLIVFSTNLDSNTMVNPVITITRLCDPDTEFTCNDGTCIPLEQVCDGVEQCPDGEDEWGCIGDECTNPAEVFVGENVMMGTYTDHPSPGFSCNDDPPNTIWLVFTAPEDGDYTISVTNNGGGFPGMAVLDGDDCAPYGDELLCVPPPDWSYTNTGQVVLTDNQTVLIAIFTDGTEWTMVDPVVTITFVEPCVDDIYSPNHTIETAAPLLPGYYQDLVLCGDDDDYFSFEVCPGGVLDIAVLFTHAQGDIDAYIRNADGTPLASGVSMDDNEYLSYRNNTDETVTLYLHVTLFSGNENDYEVLAGIDECCRGGVVISQVYGGGGNSGAEYRNDFVELHNTGSTSVSLAGWSIQYTSAGGNNWGNQLTELSGVIQPGGFYLVQLAAGTGGTMDLPTPDATGDIPMSATNGKVALVANTDPLDEVTCPDGFVDMVSYGTGTPCVGEATPALSNETAAIRGDLGCRNLRDNFQDFHVGAPIPRNSLSEVSLCSEDCYVNETGLDVEADYCVIQWPHEIPDDDPGPAVYGRIWEDGLTPDEFAPIVAQLGWGPEDVNPQTQSGFRYVYAGFNLIDGNDNEYVGMLPLADMLPGDYRYVYRFSLDGGHTWTYCDTVGSGSNEGLFFDPEFMGTLNVQ